MHILALSFPARFVLIQAPAAFGGRFVIARSVGMARMARDMLRAYIKSRLGVAVISCLLSVAMLLIGIHK